MKRHQTTLKPGVSQNRSVTGTAANATAVGDQTEQVRLFPTEDCFVNFDGAATTSSMKLKGGTAEYFSINRNTVISVISDGTDGTLNITEMTQ